MNKHFLTIIALLTMVSATAVGVEVDATELFDWKISIIKSNDIGAKQGLRGTSPCIFADSTSIVLDITRSFGIYSNK